MSIFSSSSESESEPEIYTPVGSRPPHNSPSKNIENKKKVKGEPEPEQNNDNEQGTASSEKPSFSLKISDINK